MIPRPFVLGCIVYAVVGMVPATASAPANPGIGRPARADSSVVTAVGVLMHRLLSARLSQAAVDTTTAAWELEIGGSDSVPAWALAVDTLRRAIRARSLLPSDTVKYWLRIAGVTVRRDTMVAQLSYGSVLKCGRNWMEDAFLSEARWIPDRGGGWGEPALKEYYWSESFHRCPTRAPD